MKKFSKLIMVLLSLTLMVPAVFTLTGCKEDDKTAIEELLEKIEQGEKLIKFTKDVIADNIDISILCGTTLDLDGKTLDINSFKMESDETGEYTIENGTIKSNEDIKVLMKNATINLKDINIITSDDAKVVVKASKNTLNIEGDTSFTTKTGAVASLSVEEGTRVVVGENVNEPTKIEIVGNNVDVENNSNSDGNSITIAQNVSGEINILNNGNLDNVENNSGSSKVAITSATPTDEIEVTGTNPDGVSKKGVTYSVTAHSGDTELTGKVENNTTVDLSYFANLTYLEGHEFVGWFTKDDKEVTNSTVVTSDMEIFAKFDVLTFDVIFMNEKEVHETQEDVEYGSKVTKPATDPERTGYKFIGWFNEQKPFDFENETITSKVTIYANWEIIKHTVTANSDGNKLNQEVENNGKIDFSDFANMTYKEGSEFIGWFTKDDKEVTNSTVVTSDLEIFAKFETLTFDVIFMNEKEVYETQANVEYGSKIEKPATDPVRDGYKFTGWVNELKPFDFENETITSEVTIYASWVQIFNITFMNEKEEYAKLEDVEYGSKIEKPTTDPERTGYKFTGWVNELKPFDFETDTITKEITLYASWKIQTFIVSAHSNGSELEVEVDYNSPIDFNNLANNEYLEGHEFVGWFTKDGTDGDYGTEVTNSTLVTSNMDIYGKFEIQTFNVKFMVEETEIEKEYDYNSEVNALLDSEYTLTEGYYLIKWIDGSVDTNVAEIIFPFNIKQDMEIVAQVSNEYTLTVYKNDCSEEVAQLKYAYNDEIYSVQDLSSDAEFNAVTDLEIEGFYTTADCITPISFPYVVNSDISLFANWQEAVQFPYVTYYTDYGQTHDGIFGCPRLEGDTIYLNSTFFTEGGRYRKFGYLLIAWSTDEAGLNVVAGFDADYNWVGDKYMPPMGDSSLYAQYEKLPMITYYAGDGEFVDNSKVFVGQEDIGYAQFPQAPTLEGKSFAGWFTEENGGGEEYKAPYVVVEEDENWNTANATIVIPKYTTYYAHYVDEIYYTAYANPYDEDLGLTFKDGSTSKKVVLYKDYDKSFVINPLYVDEENYSLNGYRIAEDALPALAQFNVSDKIAIKWKNEDKSLTLEANSLNYFGNPQTSTNWYPYFVEARNMFTYDANGGKFIWADEEFDKLYSYWHSTSKYSSSHAPILAFDYINTSDNYPEYIYSSYFYGVQREGYSFDGWYTLDGTETGEWGTYVQSYKFFTAGSTFFAKWEEIDTTEEEGNLSLTFDANGGKIAAGPPFEPLDATEGSVWDMMDSYGAINKVQKQGELFLGWYTENGTNNVWGNEVVMSQETGDLVMIDPETNELLPLVINSETGCVLYAKWGTIEEFMAIHPEFMDMYM